MAAISFEYSENKLILCYTPVMGLDSEYYQRLFP